MKIFFVLAAAALIASSCCAAFAQDAAREPRYARGEAVVLLRVPEEIRKNAARKLRILESSPQHTLTSEQISLFAAFTEEEDPIDEEPIDQPEAEFASRLVAELGSVDLDRLTPFDALLKLREWKEELANTLNIENRGE